MSELGDGIVVLPIGEYDRLKQLMEYRASIRRILLGMDGLPGWFNGGSSSFDEISLVDHIASEYSGDLSKFYEKGPDAPVG